jgi:hypothetical protein
MRRNRHRTQKDALMFLDWFAVFLFTGEVLIGRFYMIEMSELPMDDSA